MTLLLALGSAHGAPAPDDKSLWVSDDINKLIYEVTLDGTLLSSFHSGSVSGLALGIGPDAATIWAAKEGSNLIIHFDKAGNTLSSFPGTTYSPTAATPEGVAVDHADGTLWIVDDVTELVYHVQTDGTFIASFPTSSFDPLAISCQDIAADPADGTLWLTDNHTWTVYNVTRQGAPVSSFPVAAFDAAATNLQGIGVDDLNRSLWLTDRDTHKIYNVSRSGSLLGWIDAERFGSLNPTGVAVDPGGPWTDLGHSLAGISGAPLLVGSGSLAPSSPVTLALTNARPGAPALLLIGLSAIYAPFKGGVIVPNLDALVTLVTNASGAITLAGLWPPALPGGAKFWLQWWISDPAGPSGFAASNALLATTPSP